MTHAYRSALVALIFATSAFAADPVAAIVNGESIASAEVEALLAQAPAIEKRITPVEKKQQRLDALNLLVDERLVRQFLRQHGPKVEPAEVDRQYAALESSQKAAGKSIEAYLKEVALTPAEVRENLRLLLQLAKYLENQATTERLKGYYEATRDLFDGTTVRASHIVIRLGSTTSTEERRKAFEKLRGVRAELLAGRVEFASAAKAHSECPSGPRGGDLGFIARKFQADESFARTAFSMKPNELSDVVETETGYHLILVTERKPGKGSRFEDSLADIRECFTTDLKQAIVADLRKKARIELRLKD